MTNEQFDELFHQRRNELDVEQPSERLLYAVLKEKNRREQKTRRHRMGIAAGILILITASVSLLVSRPSVNEFEAILAAQKAPLEIQFVRQIEELRAIPVKHVPLDFYEIYTGQIKLLDEQIAEYQSIYFKSGGEEVLHNIMLLHELKLDVLLKLKNEINHVNESNTNEESNQVSYFDL